MTLGPLVPAPTTGHQPWRSPEEIAESRRRLRVTAGMVFVALGILGVVVWFIFLSPFSFSRFAFGGEDRGFQLKSAFDAGGFLETMIFVEKAGASFRVEGAHVGDAYSDSNAAAKEFERRYGIRPTK